MPWREFLTFFAGRWRQGEHVTLVGQTDSGKTTLARSILYLRRYVVVFATKSRDDSLYKPLQRQGYELHSRFVSQPDEHPKVIFRPPLGAPNAAARAAQADAFSEAMSEIFESGGWTCYFDEARYLSDNLGLSTPMETLWLQGRSLDVTMIAATQRPVMIPLEAFSQATHLFFYQESDKRNIDRMSEFTGPLFDQVRATVPRLPRHEALYIDKSNRQAMRTKVQL